MNEITIIALLVVIMVLCFLVSRVVRIRKTRKEFLFWEVDPNQQGSKNTYTGQGKRYPKGTFKIPLKITGRVTDENESTLRPEKGTRYFEKK